MNRALLKIGIWLTFLAPLTFPGTLLPGASSSAVLFPNITGTMLDEVTGLGYPANEGLELNGGFTTWVVSDPNNVFCAGCLDFASLVINYGWKSPELNPDQVTEFTMRGFAGVTETLGYSLSCITTNNLYGDFCNGDASGYTTPTSVSRSPGLGNNITWAVSLAASCVLYSGGGSGCTGAQSLYLVAETNSTAWTDGGATVIGQANSFDGPSFAGVPELSIGTAPEPSMKGLFGCCLGTVGFILWRRSRKGSDRDRSGAEALRSNG